MSAAGEAATVKISTACTSVLLTAMLAVGLVLPRPQSFAAAPPVPARTTAVCQPGPRALGTSRIVEIDARGGTKFGGQQYGGSDFLADGEVVLTFDDGPLRPTTSSVLASLERHCAKATFFMVGAMAINDPSFVKDIARRGHTIAAHTWSHRYQLRKVPIARATYEIELGFSAVQKALGAPPAPFFRFPFLSDSRAALQYLATRNIATFSIDVDAIDYKAKGPDGAEVVYNTVMNELAARKKGILLFHDIQPATVAALPRILDALKTRGFRVVHMVPKSYLTTLAEYDGVISNEAKRKQLQASLQPLSPRTVTWGAPRNWQTDIEPIPGAVGSQRTVPPGPYPQPAVQQPSALPPPLPPPAPPVRRAEPLDDWRRRIFGN